MATPATHLKFTSPYQKWLLDEFNRRKSRNARYSLRAFARDLGVSRTCLSELFWSKRRLSVRSAEALAKKLKFTCGEKRLLLNEIQAEWSKFPPRPFELSLDEFRRIFSWHYFALLSLARLAHTPADIELLAWRLRLEKSVVSRAIEDLQNLGLIQIRTGCLERSSAPFETPNEIPEETIRGHHKQILDLAMQSLDLVPVEKRCFHSTTMAIDSKNIPRAKRLMKEFRDKLAKQLESGDPDAVFTLSLQLFPLCLGEFTSTAAVKNHKSPHEPQTCL